MGWKREIQWSSLGIDPGNDLFHSLLCPGTNPRSVSLDYDGAKNGPWVLHGSCRMGIVGLGLEPYPPLHGIHQVRIFAHFTSHSTSGFSSLSRWGRAEAPRSRYAFGI